jgi:hypothetical protein
VTESLTKIREGQMAEDGRMEQLNIYILRRFIAHLNSLRLWIRQIPFPQPPFVTRFSSFTESAPAANNMATTSSWQLDIAVCSAVHPASSAVTMSDWAATNISTAFSLPLSPVQCQDVIPKLSFAARFVLAANNVSRILSSTGFFTSRCSRFIAR